MSLTPNERLIHALHDNELMAGKVRLVSRQCIEDLCLIQQIRTKPVNDFKNEVIDQRLDETIKQLQLLIEHVSKPILA